MRLRRADHGGRRRRGRAQAAVLVGLLGVTLLWAQGSGGDIVVRVDASAVAGVPGWIREQVGEALTVALVHADCPVRSAQEGEAADLTASVKIMSWRETEEETAPSSFEPTSETPRAGLVCRALARRQIEIRRAGVEKPILANEKNFSGRASPTALADRDPRAAARREALDGVTADAIKLLCKQVKELVRERARSSGPSR